MIYEFASMQALADGLRRMADTATAGPPGALTMATRVGWQAAAAVVERSQLTNQPLADEYAREYADAQVAAGVYIWASVQRFNGDPTWQPDALGGWMQP